MESIGLKDILLYVDDTSVSAEISTNLINELAQPTVIVNNDSMVVALKND